MALESFQVKKGIEVTDSVSATAYALVPVGTIGLWPVSSAVPDGWLECNGNTFSSTAYPDLAAVLGSTYGTPVGSSYVLPDFRGRIAVSSGTRNAVSYNPGAWSGAETVTITDAITSHQHTMTHTHTLNAHSHSHTGHAFNAHGVGHTHTIDSHTHPIGNNPFHTHAMWFANTGAPGTTTSRNNTTGIANTVHSNTAGDHAHTLSSNAEDTGAVTEVSGAASAETTGTASPGTTGTPSSASTSTAPGTMSTISVVQSSIVLRYIVRAY